MIAPHEITGLVLAGGRGTRMDGADKGLESWHGQPLARHALDRLRPQVGGVAISANRHLPTYAAWGVPIWSDAGADYAGPLAGMLAGLAHSVTAWLLTVPCDAPFFPADLALRLAEAATHAQSPIAFARAPDETGVLRPQPVFCLLHQSTAPSLREYLRNGGRKIRPWAEQQGCATARFDRAGDSPQAFANINTPQELQALQAAIP
ncbi:molybdenum cofactor guanylyltransferase MobA [Comamonas badia]|uniref:molybdenum cofactor guanylyltransferase MobA n=1 Tax=Comamonas badia TaxID=265291 RepID=UPI0004264125|nr:molybdenum cofactor guanylyltransferase MobA [Comamonas badia]